MTPERWDDLLLAYLTGTLPDADRADFERYLNDCEPCRDQLRAWRVIAQAARREADSRAGSLPPLPPAFYERLHLLPSANGSQAHPEKEMETMTMLAGNKHKEKRKRGRGRPVTLVAAVAAVVLSGLVLLSGRGGAPVDPVPLMGAMQQVPTFTSGDNPPSLYLTATALIAGATGTRAVVDGLWTPDPHPISQVSATPVPGQGASGLDPIMLTATQIIVEATQTKIAASGLATPVPPEMTATPIPVASFGALEPTFAAPSASGMQPIVSSPARLNASAALPEGAAAAEILLSRDGKMAAVLRLDGIVDFMNTASLESIQQFAAPDSTVTTMAFDPNRNWFALGSAGGEVYLVDANTGTQGATLEGDGSVAALTFSTDHKSLAIVRNGGTLNTLWLYDMDSGVQYAVVVFDLPLTNAAFNADGSQIAVGTLDGRVLVLDVNGAR